LATGRFYVRADDRRNIHTAVKTARYKLAYGKRLTMGAIMSST
jgi:hypothetical protein